MKFLIVSFLAALMLLLPAACRKAPINGDLDAQWQIMSVQYADGTSAAPDGSLYICISLHTLQLRGVGVHTANMAYDDKAGTISLDFPISKAEDLRPWGFDATQTSAKILRLNRKELVLLTDIAEITCRRF